MSNDSRNLDEEKDGREMSLLNVIKIMGLQSADK